VNRKKAFWSAAAFVIFGLIIGLVISSGLNIGLKGFSEEQPVISKEAVDILTKTGQAMAEVAEAVKPAVVNISTTRMLKSEGIPEPFFEDPFFRRFFGDDFKKFKGPRERKSASLGSGVIVDKDGYILTNNHVVKGADEIKVTLSDKREFTGKVIGNDPKSDIAVVKINSNHLPVLQWGDSDKLRVGETVIAIGSPYGLNQTVTSGIVSAVGRANVGIADYEDFIQTDAAINPGNSGGALVNSRGELIGINTAIFSTSGGYQGIGFAIPSNMAKSALESLIKSGKVVRGWLGVYIQPITKELAEQFGLKEEEKGALISDVIDGGPAEKAGIERGDLITEFGGKAVEDPASLRNMVAGTAPDTSVNVRLIREGKGKTLTVKIGELPEEEPKALSKKYENALNGLHVQELTADLREELDIPKKARGVVITEIDEGSPSEGALHKGDVIVEINKIKIAGIKDYDAAVSKIKPEKNVLLLVFRGGSFFYVTVSPFRQ
jgi:serine protease Do